MGIQSEIYFDNKSQITNDTKAFDQQNGKHKNDEETTLDDLPNVIVHNPENNFDESEKKEDVGTVPLLSLFQYADGYDCLCIFFATLASIGNGIAQPASFIIFGKLIQEFISAKTDAKIDILDSMKRFAVYYCIIAAAMFVCSFFQAALWSFSASRQVHKIRMKFYSSILKQDVGWFDVNEPGTLTTRLSDDLVKIQSGIGDKVGMTLQALAMFFGGFGVGFFYSWKLTLVILATSPALMICGGIMGKVIGSFSTQEQSAYAAAGAVAEEVISSIRTVVAFGGELDEIRRYNEKLGAAQKAGVLKSVLVGASMGLFHIVIFACYALAFWYGSKLVASREITAGDLMIVFFCVMIGAAQIGQVAPNFEAVTSARGAAYIVFKICSRVPTIDCLSDEGYVLDNCAGEVLFSNVHFNYPSRPDVKILQGFNLKINSGTTVALVGESGCGKSTIVKLLQRFYDTLEGSIMIDGVDIRSLNLKNMRTNIGVVSQEPILFDMSIAENISFGAVHEVSQSDIEKAARNANAHDFISALPKGYDTRVGERGAQLSGGQKQRIAIARALIRNPIVLLFDEATSALDTESEKIVQEALDKVSKGRTTIVIAHRLSTVKNADVIVVVKEGKVAEFGTHNELISKKGLYHQLVLLQTVIEEVDPDLLHELDDKEKNEILEKIKSTSFLKNDEEVVESFHRQLSSRFSMRQSKSNSPVKQSKENKDKEKKKKEEEEKVEPAPFTRIFRLNVTEWPYLVSGMFFAGLVGAFPVLFAIILSNLFKVFAKPPDEILKESVKWSLYFLGLGFLDCIGFFFSSFLFGIAGEILTRRLRTQAFTAVLRQDISFFDDSKNTTGALTARLASDASAVNGATSSRLNTMTQVIVMGITALIIAFYYSWQLTLLVIGFAPVLLIAGAAHMKVFSNFALDQEKHLVNASASAQQAIMNIRTVASLGKEVYFINLFREMLLGPYRKSMRNAIVFGITFGLSSSIIMLANAAAFTLGGKLVKDSGLEFQDMFKVVLATVFGAMIAGQIASMAPNYVAAKVSAARLFQLLDKVPKIETFSNSGNILEHIYGDIEFSGIKFNYPTRPDVQVLNDFSLKIECGKKVALVGSSGCGKSTSVGLIERFYDPVFGKVMVDGYDIKDFNLKWLRSCLGLVSQEPVLFARTIKENIVYGLDKEISMDDVVLAAKKANIHGFISNLPKGYETDVGDKGTLISGGQKQRIAIARALVRNPKIMLLDEATSALDSESEKIVQEALDVAMDGRTSVIIAHRLSTIQNADVIIVIQDGQVAESGSHLELIAKRGVYYQLIQAQL
ncbi:ATP-dependent translocase ABCB1 isoform X3 [Hydra vulgaris]|uniref:ATP-dependent translocase ABCB1 isoform X3 n=2 Tax=Hydra vulgaris TaxID=6087 RepID=A0ABM4C0Q0_HYDVU